MATISINCDQTRKVWLLWPPTPENENAFYPNFDVHDADNELFKFNRIAPHLKEGRIISTGSADAVFIPAGWIHAVITLHGGFLIGYSWSAKEESETLLRCFSLEASFGRSTHDLGSSLQFIISCLALPMNSMDNRTVAEGLKSWIELMRITHGVVMGPDEDWDKRITDSATELVQAVARNGRIPLPSKCPCMGDKGGGKKYDIRKHLLVHVICNKAGRGRFEKPTKGNTDHEKKSSE